MKLRALPIALAVACAIAAPVSHGATSGVTVTVSVASASSVDASGCGTSGRLAMPALLHGASTRSGACTVVFGSSNNTSMLRLYQADRAGDALYQPSWGTAASGFGTNGSATGVVSATEHDSASAVAVQPDGKVVVAGFAESGAVRDFAIARFDTAGVLDTTFGGGSGFVVVPVGDGADEAHGVVVQPDGYIVAAGSAVDAGTTKFAAVRVDDDGVLDPSFGTGGKVMTGAGSGNAYAEDVALQRDGKLVLAGRALGATWDVAAVRYTTTGELDDSFDGDGRALVDVASDADYGVGVAVQQDGKAVIAAKSWNTPEAAWDFSVVRLTTAGAPDAAFSGGSVTGTFGGGDDVPAGIALDSTGRILVAGDRAGLDIVVARYTDTGLLDTSFSTDGWQVTDLGDTELAYAVVADAADRVVVAGGQTTATADDLLVVRYTTGGALDDGFGSGGSVLLSPSAQFDSLYDVGIGLDGDLVFAGETQDAAGDYEMLATRMSGLPVSDYAAAGPNWAGPAGTGVFGACLEARSGAGVTEVWTVDANGDCTTLDTDEWEPVADGPLDATAKVVSSTQSGLESAQATLRFGFRAGSLQRAGSYGAPVVFEVVAPNA